MYTPPPPLSRVGNAMAGIRTTYLWHIKHLAGVGGAFVPVGIKAQKTKRKKA